ncbi:MAG: phage virion morphogenesis protein [candidate division WOR-3 bacterium]|nr:phage virion morphogenesis protein [candidate division WOR-3 bacterium]
MSDLTFGFEQALTALRSYPDRLRRAMDEGLKDASSIIIAAAKQNIQLGRPEWLPIKFPSRRVARISRTQPTPLFDTGTMMRSIHAEYEPHIAYIGWGVRYGAVHEFGTTRAGRTRSIAIPARPHLYPAWTENKDRCVDAFRKRIISTAML